MIFWAESALLQRCFALALVEQIVREGRRVTSADFMLTSRLRGDLFEPDDRAKNKDEQEQDTGGPDAPPKAGEWYDHSSRFSWCQVSWGVVSSRFTWFSIHLRPEEVCEQYWAADDWTSTRSRMMSHNEWLTTRHVTSSSHLVEIWQFYWFCCQ